VPIPSPISLRRLPALALALAACLVLVVGLAQPAEAKLKFKQPACGKLQKKVGKAKPGAPKRSARRAFSQCRANTKAYRQIRNAHYEGARTDGVEIDSTYCANGKVDSRGQVYRDGWRVVDAKVRAGGRRLTATVEAWIPGGRFVQGIIRAGNVWKVGYEFGGKINNAGVVTRTNATATCKTL